MSHDLFSLRGKIAVVTGGTGVLGSEIALGLLRAGVDVAVLHSRENSGQALLDRLGDLKSHALAIRCDVAERESVESAAEEIVSRFGKVDFLINAAGGNKPQATTNAEMKFFDLPGDALRWVLDLNLLGTIIPSQVFGRLIADQGEGSILNISSMASFRPLTRIAAYPAAKAAVNSFTQWLAVHMAQEYSPRIRVNAIAPGFFLTEQNRFLMLKPESGAVTERGKKILDHTPMARFGEPEDLVGAVLWLLSPASRFVTGVVIPIDGGFSAYSGV